MGIRFHVDLKILRLFLKSKKRTPGVYPCIQYEFFTFQQATLVHLTNEHQRTNHQTHYDTVHVVSYVAVQTDQKPVTERLVNVLTVKPVQRVFSVMNVKMVSIIRQDVPSVFQNIMGCT